MEEKKKTILLVDDDQDIVEINSRIVGRRYNVLSALSATECLQIMRTVRPDLIVMDVIMENMTAGLDAVKTMEKEGILDGVPVLFLTSVNEHFDYRLQVDEDYYPMVKWMDKPIKPTHLLNTIRELMDRCENLSPV